jgi:hypothetical protein
MPQVVLAPSSAGSAPDNQKYPVDDFNEPTPFTLLYVKGRTLRTIEVADAIVMATRRMHGRTIPSECAVVEVTTIKEGHEFEDLDYPDEEEGIEKLKYAKRNFILWPRKYIIMKTCSSLIVSPHSREDEGTPTSQNTIRSTTAFTPPYENPPKTTPHPKNQTSTQPLEHHSPQHRSPPHGHSSRSPPHTTPPLQNLPTEQAPQQHSPPYVHSLKPPHTTPPLQHPSTEQAPQQHSPPHVHSAMIPPHSTPRPQNPSAEQAPQQRSSPHAHSPKSPPHTTPHLQIPPNGLKKKDATVDETSKDPKTVHDRIYDGLKNYKTKKPLEDLALVGMSVKDLWQHGDKDIWEFEYGKLLVLKHVQQKLRWIMQKLHKWYYFACVYGLNFIEAKIPGDILNTSSFDLNVELAELHTIYHLQMLDITMITVWCM